MTPTTKGIAMNKQTAKEVGVIALGTAIGAAIHTVIRASLTSKTDK